MFGKPEIEPGDQVTWTDEQAKLHTPPDQMFLVTEVELTSPLPYAPGDPLGSDLPYQIVSVHGRNRAISADRLKVVPIEKTIPPFLYSRGGIVTVPK